MKNNKTTARESIFNWKLLIKIKQSIYEASLIAQDKIYAIFLWPFLNESFFLICSEKQQKERRTYLL